MLTQAKPIPVAFGQALALKDKLASGLSMQAAKKLSMVSERVYDLLGTPFYQITIVTDQPKGAKFWDVISSFDPGSTYNFYGTGASDVRGLYNFQFDNSAVEKLKRTRELAGSYKQLVASVGTSMYLLDANGQYWDIWSGKVVSQTKLENEKKLYLKIKSEFENAPTLVEETKNAWKAAMGDASGSAAPTQGAQINWASVTQPDGNLDIAKFLAQHGGATSQGVSTQSDYLYPTGFLNSILVYGHIVGDMADSNTAYWDNLSNDPTLLAAINDDKWGNNQLVAQVSPYVGNTAPNGGVFKDNPFSNGGTWGMRDVAPTGVVFTQYCNSYGCYQYSQNGCAAQTVARLMGWYYRKKGISLGFGSDVAIAWDMMRPEPADNAPANIYEPYMSKLMGSGSWKGENTATTPNGFLGVTGGGLLGGANAWLNGRGDAAIYQGNRLQLVGPPYYFQWLGWLSLYLNPANYLRGVDPNFNWWTWQIHNFIRQTIHDKNEPAIGLFHTTSTGGDVGLNGHYPLVFAYRNFANPFYVDVQIWVSADLEGYNITPNGWVTITNRWDTMGGIWALNTPAPPPPPSPPPSACNNPHVC